MYYHIDYDIKNLLCKAIEIEIKKNHSKNVDHFLINNSKFQEMEKRWEMRNDNIIYRKYTSILSEEIPVLLDLCKSNQTLPVFVV